MQSKDIYCNPFKLQTFIKVNNSNFIEINDTGIYNFWPSSSKFLCGLNTTSISDISQIFTSNFTLPANVKEVKTQTIINF